MEIGAVLINLALFTLSAVLLIKPFFREQDDGSASETSGSALTAEKERLLAALENLDDEYRLDKIAKDNYQRKRKYLLSQAAGILKTLDDLGIQPEIKSSESINEPEEELDDLDALIESRKREFRQDPQKLCPQCGAEVNQFDQFCGHCGETL
jgi:hypothetical protein